MKSTRIGTSHHSRIVNHTAALHPFHIHQIRFLAYTENRVPLARQG
jgi:hypothetical protein